MWNGLARDLGEPEGKPSDSSGSFRNVLSLQAERKAWLSWVWCCVAGLWLVGLVLAN